jgi:GNAT superfamily N-acetyltransferase
MKWELSFAAWHDDVPIGYAILSSKTTVRAHLHHLMIGQGWRGTGIGSRLLDRACVRAAEHGHSAFTLKVAMDSPARRFYERHGFAPHGHENGYSVYRRSL